MAMWFLGVMGLLLIGIVRFIARSLARKPVQNKPLTSTEPLTAAPRFNSNPGRHPRLTLWGKVLAVMIAAVGVVAAMVLLPLGWRMGTTGLKNESLPSVGMGLVIDSVPGGFALLLRTTRRLLTLEKFAAGIGVAPMIVPIKFWGIHYDSLDGSGQVSRGYSRQIFYTVALTRSFQSEGAGDYFRVGSHVAVLYYADDPSRNALYVSFCRAIWSRA